MAKKWNRWEDQSPFKREVRSILEAAPRPKSEVVEMATKKVSIDSSESGRQVDELLDSWLVFADDTGNIRLTEWQHESLIKATGQADYPGAIMFLFDKGVWHPDMDRYGMTDDGETASEEAKRAESEAAAAMVTMPDRYDKVKKIDKAQGDSMTFKEVPEGAERVTSAVQTAGVEAFKEESHEFTIGEIMEKTKGINPLDLAVEIGDWITSNVEQFIDNRESVFRMYLTIKSDMAMPVSSLYQRLYLSIPDEDETKGITNTLVESLIDALDAKLEKAKNMLSEDEEFLNHLFERMVYFYELTGFLVVAGKVQQALRQRMGGRVQINELVFDPISLTTTVAQGVGQHSDGKVREGNKKVVVKKEVMPAGFGIEIEIAISPKNKIPMSIY